MTVGFTNSNQSNTLAPEPQQAFEACSVGAAGTSIAQVSPAEQMDTSTYNVNALSNENLPDLVPVATVIPMGVLSMRDLVATSGAAIPLGFTNTSSYSQASGAFGTQSVWQPSTSGGGDLSLDVSKQSGVRYVGLVNQAMTCYLNSLLQTLFMTPEFRNAIYRWEFSGSPEDQTSCIPFQIQKLFLLLQTTEKSSLETKDLTRSFGWDSSHAWDQHDVQELCRVMFDALEHQWRKTDQHNLINFLYQGTVKDYVKCQECNKENARQDVFLDLPLAVRPFGSQDAYGSIEEALKAFVQPEILDQTNQYFCENCKRKCDAHKGLKITKFPYLLTIQLKRFDFDYSTLTRVKLNDKMSFSGILNLNSFVENARSHDAEASQGTSAESANDETAATAASAGIAGAREPGCGAEDVDEGICLNDGISPSESGKNSPSHNSSYYNDVFTADNAPCTEFTKDMEKIKAFRKEGPYVYELFSIMIHSGSANGGHYYAYIKNLDTDEWWCFNDQLVSVANVQDLLRSYGGRPTTWTYSYGQANAYMLMYRQVNPNKNAKFIPSEELPEHLLRLLDQIKNVEVERRQREEYERSLLKIKLYCYLPGHKQPVEENFHIPRTITLKEAKTRAYELLRLKSYKVDVNCCRLVKYSRTTDCVEYSFTCDDQQKKMDDLNLQTYYNVELLMEILPSHVQFRDYAQYDDIESSIVPPTFRVTEVDVKNERMMDSFLIRANASTDTQQDLLNLIAEYINCKPAQLHVVAKLYNGFKIIDAPEKTLKESLLAKKVNLFVEVADHEENIRTWHEPDFSKTSLYKLLDRFENSVMIRVELPSKEDYEVMGVSYPPLEYLSSLPDASSASYYVNEGSPSTATELSVETVDSSSCAVNSSTSAVTKDESVSQQHYSPKRTMQGAAYAQAGTCSTYSTGKDMYLKQHAEHGFVPPTSSSVQKRIAGASSEFHPPMVVSDTTSEYSTASDYSGVYITPGESRPPTPEVGTRNVWGRGSSSANLPSPEASSDLSSPSGGLSSPNVSPVTYSMEEQEPNFSIGVFDSNSPEFNLHDSNVDQTTASTSGEARQYCELSKLTFSDNSGSFGSYKGAFTPNTSPVNSGDNLDQVGVTDAGRMMDWVSDAFQQQQHCAANEPSDGDDTIIQTAEGNEEDLAGPSSAVELSDTGSPPDEEVTYFCLKNIDEKNGKKILEIAVDKRMCQSTLKQKLAPYVKAVHDQFKMFKICLASEFEWKSANDSVCNLSCIPVADWKRGKTDSGVQVRIKLGRPLEDSEMLLKVYEFLLNEKEYSRFCFELICQKNLSVVELKNRIVDVLKQQREIDLSPDRANQHPKQVFLDHEQLNVFVDHYISSQEYDIYFQLLPDKDTITSDTQFSMFCRRWRPSSLTIDPFQEITLEKGCTLGHCLELLSKKSKIPIQQLEVPDPSVLHGSAAYPFETSKITILEWDGRSKWIGAESQDRLHENLSNYPWHLDAGCHIFYRDNTEPLKTLNEQEKRELQIRENARLRRSSVYSGRRERALKIFTEFSSSQQVDDELDMYDT